MDEDSRLASVDEVPTDSTMLVTLAERDGVDEHGGEDDADGHGDGDSPDAEVEAILTRLDDGTVVAFRNRCRHWTDVKLDRGDGAAVRGDRVICRKHGATFERDSGYCDFGPCEGSTLATVDVAVEDGDVDLADDGYAFVCEGGTEPDPEDLSSGSRIGFDGV